MSKLYPPDALLETVRVLPPDRPFTTQQAQARGVGVDARRQLVAAGLLVRPLRSVYWLAGLTDCLSLRMAALRLIVPPDCVVTDRTAAWLWGAEMALAPGDHLTPPQVSVFAPPGRRLRNEITASGERSLARRDVVELDGLRVTSPLRTACDAGRLLHRDQALAVMDAIAGLRHFSPEYIGVELQRFKGYRGIIQARMLAPLVDPKSGSQMESILRLRWIDAGLPRPRCQVEIEAPRGSYFLDISDPESKFAAEFDGEQFHGPDRREHDDGRREWARVVGGWTILVFRNNNVVGRHQDAESTLRREWAAHQSLTRRESGDPSRKR